MAKKKTQAAAEAPAAAPAPAAPPAFDVDALAAKVRKYFALREEGKRKYARAGELQDELIAALRSGSLDKIPLGEKQFARLRDNFAKGNKAYQPAGVERFSLEIVSEE